MSRAFRDVGMSQVGSEGFAFLWDHLEKSRYAVHCHKAFHNGAWKPLLEKREKWRTPVYF
jgi:hypothetical protein